MPNRARCAFEFHTEITRSSHRSEPPWLRESVQGDLPDLVDEALVSAALADQLPPEADDLEIVVEPIWEERPLAFGIRVSITGPTLEGRTICREFRSGRWLRRARRRAWQAVEDGAVAEDEQLFVRLVAEARRHSGELSLPAFRSPSVSAQPLEALGVARLGDEPLCEDRPVLVNARAVQQILTETEEAGATEIGGAVLGKIVRLNEPLPGTVTRIVTVLTTALSDPRHAGVVGRVTFDPGALAQAAGLGALRGLGERVLTAYHSHGWGSACGRCNQNADCAVPSASYVSPDDYRVLESLFPDKGTLMPIAGRSLGAEGDRPVLVIHAWRNGRMEPIPWRTYHD
jgi:hypothetical protein